MYFYDRGQAGEQLAEQLMDYRFENTVVLALSPGGVAVGEAIARRLHTQLCMLLTAKITAPGDESLVLGTLDETGLFTYNSMIPAGQMEEYLEDMRGWVEEEKIRQLYQMTTVLGENGLSDPGQLAGRNVIITTDGVKNGLSFDAAVHFLKRLSILKTIAAIPVGPAETIERLSSVVDEVHYLYIPDNFLTVSHYYTGEERIEPDTIMGRINNIVSNWM